MHLSTYFFDMPSLSPVSLYLQSLCTVFLFWHVADWQPEALRSLMPAQRCLGMNHVAVPGSATEHKSFQYINISLWFLFSLCLSGVPKATERQVQNGGKEGVRTRVREALETRVRSCIFGYKQVQAAQHRNRGRLSCTTVSLLCLEGSFFRETLVLSDMSSTGCKSQHLLREETFIQNLLI